MSVRVAQTLVPSCIVLWVILCLFVLLAFAIVLSVLRCMASVYTLDIFKLFLYVIQRIFKGLLFSLITSSMNRMSMTYIIHDKGCMV